MSYETPQRLLASLYAITRRDPEAALSTLILSKSLKVELIEMQETFSQWEKEGLVEKKYDMFDVYSLTQKGAAAVEAAFWERNNHY